MLAATEERELLRAEVRKLQDELTELSLAKNTRAIRWAEFHQRKCVILANLRPGQRRLSELNKWIKGRNRVNGQGPIETLLAATRRYLVAEDEAGRLNDAGKQLLENIETDVSPNILLREPDAVP